MTRDVAAGTRRHRKNVLVVFSYVLSPDRDAGSLRMYQILKLLRDMSWRVTFCVSDLQTTDAQRAVLKATSVTLLETPVVESVEAHLQQHGEEYDLVVLSALSVALKYLGATRRYAPKAKLIFDTTDLQHVREFRRARATGEGGWLPIALRSKKWELGAVQAADLTLVVSPREKAVLEEACPGKSIQILSVIQTAYGSATPVDERKGLLFIGSFPHHPNVDGMRYFIENVHPLIRNTLRDVTVDIVGPEPPAWLQGLSARGLNVIGYVPNVEPYFSRCRLSIAPLRYGAGVNGKVVLSMAYGVPVVASAVAAEGLMALGGRDLLVADDPRQFADAVIALYTDPRLWNRLSANGLRVVSEHYSVEVGRTGLMRALDTLGLG